MRQFDFNATFGYANTGQSTRGAVTLFMLKSTDQSLFLSLHLDVDSIFFMCSRIPGKLARCSFPSIILLGLVLTGALVPSVYADGEKDNHPDRVRRIPRLGVVVAEEDQRQLENGLAILKTQIEALQRSPTRISSLLPDVEIYYRAVRDNLDYQEFFNPGEVKRAIRLLEVGQQRAKHLLAGQAPWLDQTGLVVRGFRSELDDTVQPYGLVIPETYQPESSNKLRLDIWFHGRGETLSETNFIHQRATNAGYYQPENTIVLHPYGRYSNAFKFAGEVDVLESLAHASANYQIDKNRISVRGFSMGGAACWQFAFLYADRWFAANPGAGFSETPEFLKSFQKETLKPYPWEEKLWRWYDADDSAINFYHVPTIAYSGENDIQKQAADVMENALAKEGISLVHLIGPKTGHRIHIDTQKEIGKRMASLAEEGNQRSPKTIHKLTHTLKYNRQYWLSIDSIEQHWEPSQVMAQVKGNLLQIQCSGITGFHFRMPSGTAPFELTQPVSLEINSIPMAAPNVQSDRSWEFQIHFDGKKWVPGPRITVGLVKKSGLQGPLDDAFMSSFLMVTPTGLPLNKTIGGWVDREQDRAVQQWRQHFRGHARTKQDVDVTDDDIANHNLILWGDTSSNQILKKVIADLPLEWNAETLRIGHTDLDPKRHAAIMVYPNPLNPEKYIVINSGFTYREYAYLNNARQVPKLPDWALVDIVSKPKPNDSIYRFPGIPRAADFFDEFWKVK